MAELNQITYKPNKWVNDSAPDLEADTLNNIESGIIQATELLNGLVTEYKNLVSKKMIVNDFLSTNSETVLSGPMGKLLNEKYEQLNRDFDGLNAKVIMDGVKYIRFSETDGVIGISWLSKTTPQIGWGINIYKSTAMIELFKNDGTGWVPVWSK